MTFHTLAGLPRSGSTVLAAILNQHPDVHVSATSGLIDLMGASVSAWENNPSIDAQGRDHADLYRLLRGVLAAHYEKVAKPVIIDKSRGWPAPAIMQTMTHVLGRPLKIVATVRNVPDCAASFVRIAKPKDVSEFLRTSHLIEHLKSSYVTLKAGYDAQPESFCLVDYDDLMDNPKRELKRVHDFLGLKPHTYNFKKIEGAAVAEKDEVWNVPGLHDIAPVLGRRHGDDSREVLGTLYDSFDQPAFWRGEETRPPQLLDLQLAAGLSGNFELGWELARHLERERPDDNRAAFNRGWYLLHQGKLQKGHKLLDRGRIENVFGNKSPSPMPIWDGKKKGTVLLNLEGGLGDQIHGARFAKDIAARGCTVIIACSGELAQLFRNIEGVVAVVQHEAVFGVVHDYWVPSMSAVVALGYEFKDLSGDAYLPSPDAKKARGAKLRIGLRWVGNPGFEHEQHRRFPSKLLFDAVKGIDAEFISLQRDDGVDEAPKWVKRVPLSHWGDTRAAAASCDLIITSCTSVAHLAASLGVPTWIVVPILPYYLWALPGNTTPYYDSVQLFRQSVPGDWKAPFEQIHEALLKKYKRVAKPKR